MKAIQKLYYHLIITFFFTAPFSLHAGDAFCVQKSRVPDFASMPVEQRKQVFISTLVPFINEINKKILVRRGRLEKFSKIKSLHRHDIKWLKKTGEMYHYPAPERPDNRWFEGMLERVDILPPSLVIVQAATESAWGTSRFAREGNNYFGIWCYSPGCGLVPGQRAPGKTHEVRKFCSMGESVRAYYRNINTNSAYQLLRTIRARERKHHHTLDSLSLLQGLEKYSERGQAYISSLSQWIIRDNLRRFDRTDDVNYDTGS